MSKKRKNRQVTLDDFFLLCYNRREKMDKAMLYRLIFFKTYKNFGVTPRFYKESFYELAFSL